MSWSASAFWSALRSESATTCPAAPAPAAEATLYPQDRGDSAERNPQPIRALGGLVGQFVEGLVENEHVQQEALGFAEFPVSAQEGCDRGLLPGRDLLGLALFDVARIWAVMGVGETGEGHAPRLAEASDHPGDVADGQVGLGPLN